MRGGARQINRVDGRPRITPACAGRRWRAQRSQAVWRDHPRVCGEEAGDSITMTVRSGSPPRVRGGGISASRAGHRTRITPACAGRSSSASYSACVSTDHPRVCGEEMYTRSRAAAAGGSPPRVRGGGHLELKERTETRITPACAGRSKSPERNRGHTEDHPRVCGEEQI